MRAPKLKSIPACDYLDLTIIDEVFRCYGLLNHQDLCYYDNFEVYWPLHAIIVDGSSHWSNNAMFPMYRWSLCGGLETLKYMAGGWGAPQMYAPNFAPITRKLLSHPYILLRLRYFYLKTTQKMLCNVSKGGTYFADYELWTDFHLMKIVHMIFQ